MRGRGDSTIAPPNFGQDPNPPPGVKGDSSFALSIYELTADVVYKHFVLLTSMGGGEMRVRARTPSAMASGTPTLEETDGVLDIWGGLGVGYQVVEAPEYHLAVFGLYTHSIFVLDDQPSLPNRFSAGIEIGVGPHDRFGMVARLGLTHASGPYANIDSSRTGDLSCTAIMLQLGGFLSLTLGDK